MKHVKALSESSGIQVLAVPMRKERLKQLTSDGVAAVGDVQEAARQGASLGIVATDTGLHAAQALKAMRLGLDILIEKPMAADFESGRLLLKESKKLGRRVFVGCVMRFSESLNTFRNFLCRLGRLHHVAISCQSYLPSWRPQRPYKECYSARMSGGGVLLDLIHEIDYAGWIYGWPAAVYACLRNKNRLGIEAEETAHLVWETQRGGTVSITLDYLSQPPRRVMVAFGEKGTLQWDGVEKTVIFRSAGHSPEIISSNQTIMEMFQAQDEAFVSACRGKKTKNLATAKEGLQAMAVCEAARLSSKLKREKNVVYG